MQSAYEAAIDNGVRALDEWVAKNNVTGLPDDCWKLPADCPLWSMGLSMAQAGGILANARRKMSETSP